MVGHDLVTPLEPKTFLEGRLSTWNSQFFGISQVLILGTILTHFIDAIPSFFGFSLETSQKLVYIFWFFLMGFSAYVLASVIKPRNFLFKFAVVLFYQFNFFILQGWWIAEKSKFSAYIALPLVLSVLFLVESRKLSVVTGAILNSFVFFFFNASGLYGLPLYGGLLVVIGCLLVFTTVNNWYSKSFSGIKRLISLSIITGVLTLLINSYFFLPAILRFQSQLSTNISQVGGISGIISWAEEISANTSFTNLMRLEGIPEWYDNPFHPYAKMFLTNPLLIAISFLWPLIAFSTLYIVKTRINRRYVLYFFFVYLLGMFFAAGTHPPLGFLYQFLVEKIPVFIVFRSPYFKFAPALYIASAILFAFFLDSLSQRVRRKTFVLFFAILIIYHFPFFSGNFFTWREGYSTRLSVPHYVFEFGNWLRSQPPSTRVLMVPPNSPDLQYSLYTWGYLSFQALPTLLSNVSVVINNDKLNSEERNLTMELYEAIATANNSRSEMLLELLGISHVVVARDTDTKVKSSIPLDVSRYEKGLIETDLLDSDKTFGAWQVYKVRQRGLGTIFAVNNPTIIDAQQDDVSLVTEYPMETSAFMLKSDVHTSESVPAFIVPTCANCLKKSKPVVIFPERNILPGDPFYSLVLLAERLRKTPTDPKSAIYNLLGISLKRISEINEMLFTQKGLSQDVVDRYIQLLESIEKNFASLPYPQDKIEVGSDITHYLRAQRNFLRPNLGKYVSGGPQTVLAGSIFTAIAKTENTLSPFIAPLSGRNSRLYYFNLDAPSSLGILIRTRDVKQFEGLKKQISLRIDEEEFGSIFPDYKGEMWQTFGTKTFTAGFHTLTLTLPDSAQPEYELMPVETEFNVRDENSCFGTKVDGVSSTKLYKTLLRYKNDFSDNLIFFAWEKERDIQKLLAAVKIPVNPFEEKLEEIFELSPGVSEMTIALCAPNLTQERIAKQFRLQVGEAIYPSLLFASTNDYSQSLYPIEYRKRSATHYEIEFPESATLPVTMVFSERFDSLWELQGAQSTHVKVNSYANGWIIEERPETRTLTLSYKGERYLRWGAFMSILTFILGGLYLRRKL